MFAPGTMAPCSSVTRPVTVAIETACACKAGTHSTNRPAYAITNVARDINGLLRRLGDVSDAQFPETVCNADSMLPSGRRQGRASYIKWRSACSQHPGQRLLSVVLRFGF